MNEMKMISEEIFSVINQIDDLQLDEVVNQLDKNKRIFISGEGRSGLVGKCFAIRLMHLGYLVSIVSDTLVPAMQKEDVLIALTGSGTSEHTLLDIKKAKNKKCKIFTFTSKMNSEAALLSDVNVIIPATIRSDSGSDRKSNQLLGSLFDQSLHVVLDAITIKISKKDSISNEKATSAHW